MEVSMENRKIVFFDIDGTIYLYGKGVPDDTSEGIRKMRDKGNIAVLCTGRTVSMIFPEILEVGFDGIIAGAGTYVEYNSKELYRYVMPEALTNEVINAMRKQGIMAIPEGIEHIYFDSSLMPEDYIPVYELYKASVGENVVDMGDIIQVVASKVSGAAKNDENIQRMRELFGDRFTFVKHQNKYLEMIPKGYSKAEGIKRLIEHLGIPWENTYAFGDSMNDYEMLKYVKYGIAMGNAEDEFKSEMNYVTDDYDKGGIYNALKKFELI